MSKKQWGHGFYSGYDTAKSELSKSRDQILVSTEKRYCLTLQWIEFFNSQGFSVAQKYNPDFMGLTSLYLPELDLYVSIFDKHTDIFSMLYVYRSLCNQYDGSVLLCFGTPEKKKTHIVCWGTDDGGAGLFWGECFFTKIRDKAYIYVPSEQHTFYTHDGFDNPSNRILDMDDLLLKCSARNIRTYIDQAIRGR